MLGLYSWLEPRSVSRFPNRSLSTVPGAKYVLNKYLYHKGIHKPHEGS